LAELADASGVDLLYEAAVAGASDCADLRESLAGEQIVRVMGIVNGTTNFILTGWKRTASTSPMRWRKHNASVSPNVIPPPMSKDTMRRQRRRSWPPGFRE